MCNIKTLPNSALALKELHDSIRDNPTLKARTKLELDLAWDEREQEDGDILWSAACYVAMMFYGENYRGAITYAYGALCEMRYQFALGGAYDDFHREVQASA